MSDTKKCKYCMTEIPAKSQDIPDDQISYITISAEELCDTLDKSVEVAADTYIGSYVELTGRLSIIDSGLKYIEIYAINEEYCDIDEGTHCTIMTDEQKEIVKTLEIGNVITVKGKITNVEELFGYWLDIKEIIVE